jgi:glycosyltransferase involved in cell wall biosynthesis
MKNPLVSVVLTSYNHLNLLKKALKSLLEQTYSQIEIIIVDDGSKDGSREWIVEQSEMYPERIVAFLQPFNVGLAKNKNTGFKLAKGDFITLCDGDDFYFPDKIEKELELLLNDSDCNISFSNFEIHRDGKVKNWAESQNYSIPFGYILSDMLLEKFPMKLIPRFPLYRRTVFEQIGYYAENLKSDFYEDWDFLIRAAQKFYFAYNPNVGSVYVNNSKSVVNSVKMSFLLTCHRNILLKYSSLVSQLGEEGITLNNFEESHDKMITYNLFLEKSEKRKKAYIEFVKKYGFDFKTLRLYLMSFIR